MEFSKTENAEVLNITFKKEGKTFFGKVYKEKQGGTEEEMDRRATEEASLSDGRYSTSHGEQRMGCETSERCNKATCSA